MCSLCKGEIAWIEVINGQVEMKDVLLTCDTCKKVFHEMDLICTNTHPQGARFEKQNPYEEGC